MRIVLRNVRWICTPGGVLENGHVSIRDRRIEQVQDAPIAGPADETVELDGCLLIPGLISLHHHFFQHVTRAWPGLHCAASEDWLAGLYPVWARMQPRDFAAAARNAAAILGRTELGAIAPGMSADLAAFDLRGVDAAGALADPLAGFLLAG